jgi:hypothetical protein
MAIALVSVPERVDMIKLQINNFNAELKQFHMFLREKRKNIKS